MSIDWAAAYEAPISLDDSRLIGTRERRPTLWTMAALFVIVPAILGIAAVQFPPVATQFQDWVPGAALVLLPIASLWALVCYAFGSNWGGRRVEFWITRYLRHRRIPGRISDDEIARHHANLWITDHIIQSDEFPRAVVEVETLNLQMNDSATLASHIQKLHAFFLGLEFPIQIVVRAWAGKESVDRRWFVAINADTNEILDDRLASLVNGLKRAGLGGRPLNGDLYDSLQKCWTVSPHQSHLGPGVILHARDHAIVDGEYVRGLLLSKFPRTIDPNWLAPMLDGDLPVDFSMWLDPIDNAEELDVLNGRINEWETAQQLNTGPTGTGFRSSDIDDSIRDASRTKLFLRRRMLRMFRGSVAFVVRGPDMKTTRARERLLVAKLREQIGVNAVIPADFEHDRAPLLVVPIGEQVMGFPLQIVSPALAMSYMFSNSSISMDGGIDVGTSIGSKRKNKLNLFGLTNPHMIIPGTTGSGKGYWVKIFLWRLLHDTQEARVYVIQSEKDEYSALAEAMEPKLYELLPPYAQAEIVRIHSLDDFEKKVYFGQTKRLLPSRKLIVFDLTKMPASDKGKGISLLIESIEQSMAWGRVGAKAVLVIDELGIVLRDKEAANAIETAYRRFRSIPLKDNSKEVGRVAVIGMTQLPQDLLGHQNGKVLAGLAETGLYLRQKPPELAVTKGPLNLSPDEVSFLTGCQPGDALLVAGRSRVALHLQATPFEHELAKT